MSRRHYARDAIENPLNALHQRCTWPLHCAICSDPDKKRSTVDLFFAPTVDSEDRFICCIPLDPPETIPNDNSEIDALPLVFTVIGQIAPEDCFLTSTGDERGDRPDHVRDGPVASCWLESRPDRDSCVEWRQLPSAIERVASSAVAGTLDTSRVLRFAPNDRAVQLRVRFSPDRGKLLKDTLPFFHIIDNKVVRRVPKTVDEVPLDTPFRATFTFEYVREGGKQYLYADLITLDTI